MRDFSTEELVEERKGKEKMFDEIRKKRVDEKKIEKKKKKRNEKKTKKREEGLVGFFLKKKNYNYTSPQQIKIKYIIIAVV